MKIKPKKKEKIQIGDIFEIYITNNMKQFVQYVADYNYFGNCSVVKIIDKVFPSEINFEESMLMNLPFYHEIIWLKPAIRSGILTKIPGLNYTFDTSEVRFKQIIDIYVPGLVDPKKEFRIFKVGQKFEDTKVSRKMYEKYEDTADRVGVCMGPAFKSGLLGRYDIFLMYQYSAELIAQYDDTVKKLPWDQTLLKVINANKLPPPESSIKITFVLKEADNIMDEINSILSYLDKTYYSKYIFDLDRLQADLLFSIPHNIVTQFVNNTRSQLMKYSAIPAKIYIDEYPPFHIESKGPIINSNILNYIKESYLTFNFRINKRIKYIIHKVSGGTDHKLFKQTVNRILINTYGFKKVANVWQRKVNRHWIEIILHRPYNLELYYINFTIISNDEYQIDDKERLIFESVKNNYQGRIGTENEFTDMGYLFTAKQLYKGLFEMFLVLGKIMNELENNQSLDNIRKQKLTF